MKIALYCIGGFLAFWVLVTFAASVWFAILSKHSFEHRRMLGFLVSVWPKEKPITEWILLWDLGGGQFEATFYNNRLSCLKDIKLKCDGLPEAMFIGAFHNGIWQSKLSNEKMYKQGFKLKWEDIV